MIEIARFKDKGPEDDKWIKPSSQLIRQFSVKPDRKSQAGIISFSTDLEINGNEKEALYNILIGAVRWYGGELVETV